MFESVGWLAGFGLSNLLSMMVMPFFSVLFPHASADCVRSLGRSCITNTLTGEGLHMLLYFCFNLINFIVDCEILLVGMIHL